MSGFVFGQDAPCRGCHGAGQRVEKMTPEQQRERNRELRRAKRGERGATTFDHVSPLKPCSECGGKGYVPIAVADGRRG